MKRTILAGLLALCMYACALPARGFAEGIPEGGQAINGSEGEATHAPAAPKWAGDTVAVIQYPDGSYEEYETLKRAVDSASQSEPVTIQIVADTVETKTIYAAGSRNITLTADAPRTIQFSGENMGTGISVCADAAGKHGTLTITDNITITGGEKAPTRMLIDCQSGSELVLDGGTLAVESAMENSVVYVTGGSFTMKRGTIRGGNRARGIFARNWSDDSSTAVHMEGGEVTECVSDDGGGIAVAAINGHAEFNMTGGTISGCNATETGGGVDIRGNRAVFTMAGGSITGCNAQYHGGGVYAKDGAAFEMTGGSICNNRATGSGSHGGGIKMESGTSFRMSGGEVCGNTAGYIGGGIDIDTEAGPACITAGTISRNKVEDAFGYGGGIYVDKGSTLQLKNTTITENTATSLGGGIWACRTGNIEIYVTDGGAVYDNDAIGADVKTPDQAGDDIAFYCLGAPVGTGMTLYTRMLGGGLNHYYEDGGLMPFSGGNHNEGPGLGAPDGATLRYGSQHMAPCTDTANITSNIALKNVVPDDAKAAAQTAAKLIITGNFASRGGGIGTNGNLIIGKPHDVTYSVTIRKAWAAGTPDGKKTPVSVYLKIGEEKFGPVTLNAENEWEATFTGLTDKPEEVKYTAVEEPVPEGFTPSYSEAVFNGTAGTIVITNAYSPAPPAPETGSLRVSKTVSGDGADYNREFQFTVTLVGVTITGTYGDMTFTDGKAVFTLKNGESKTAEGLPAGIGYTVTERDNAGYTVTKTGDTGNIPANGTAEARFNNHKGSIPDIPVDPVWPDVPDVPVIPDSPEPPHTGEPCHLAWLLLLAVGALLAVLGLAGRNRRSGKHRA